MSFNAWTKNGCSRLINEQMAEALWVAVPCVHISLMWELRRTEDWLFCSPICTGDPLHLHISRKRLRREKKQKNKIKKKCNFLSCTEEVFAHSGSKLTTPSTRFRLVHWAHDTPLHGVCSAGNTRRVCKQLGWASVLFLQLFYLCFSPPSAHPAEWRNWMHPLGPVASMDSNEQLVTVNEEQAEEEERCLSDFFNNEKR